MKRIFTSIMLVALALTASAQSYHNGIWYSLYQENESSIWTINHIDLPVFAPTNGDLSFFWKYSGALFASNTTTIQESVNGSDFTKKGEITGTSQKNYPSAASHVEVSQFIQTIRFDRAVGNTNTTYYKNIELPLAQHILLSDGSLFGTSALADAYMFDTVYAKHYAADTLHVSLRSFLAAADITITSDNAAFLVSRSSLQVEANACASQNGTAGELAAEGVLGDINEYGFDVLFYPQSAGEQSATITISDGVSVATVAVAGYAMAIPASYAEYTATICQGSSIEYNGTTYTEAFDGEVVLSEPNYMLGDSIIRLHVDVLLAYWEQETLEFFVGDAHEWHGQNLALLEVGNYVLYDSLQTVNGCDSVITLTLQVKELVSRDIVWDDFVLAYEIAEGAEDTILLTATCVAADAVLYTLSCDSVARLENVDQLGTVLVIFAAGEATITASVDADVVEGWTAASLSYDFVVTEAQPVPTAINATATQQKATKVLRNGQICILRDGRTYNVLGF